MQQWRDLLDALPMPALLTDGGGAVIHGNLSARQSFSADPAGENIVMFLRGPAIGQAIREAAQNHESSSINQTMRGSNPRTYEVHVAPVAGGEFVLITFWDKTREQQIERMRSDFVANASHELRTPLATLAGFIETMQGSAREDTAARDKFLGVMKTQAERMSRLIDDLLSLSRIEISEHVLPAGHADLADVTRQAMALLAPMAKELSCAIEPKLEQPLPVLGDTAELLQVMLNLIENAMKYGASGKRVEIVGRIEGDKAVVDVRDFGPGIAAHHIPRLTERFYRVNVQDSRTRGGTGLGLAIVKHIVNRHRGRLSISSEVGRGSCFSVRLPLEK